MAASKIPAPGTEYGPCDPTATCEHVDCEASVEQAGTICSACSWEIGYNTLYYLDGDGEMVHARCLEEATG